MERRQFSSPELFRQWLEKNHAGHPGIWLRIFKKASKKKTISYAEALDQALCFGWIDGQVKSLDEISYQQRFTPRRAASNWSKTNTQHVQRLLAAGQMAAAGLAAVEAAKADGRWRAAYDSPKDAKAPEDFLSELSKDPKALAFFQKLNKANVYAICYRLQTARKPETRARRMKVILQMLAEGKAFHP